MRISEFKEHDEQLDELLPAVGAAALGGAAKTVGGAAKAVVGALKTGAQMIGATPQTGAAPDPQQDPQAAAKAQAMAVKQMQDQKKQIQDQIKQTEQQLQDLRKKLAELG